MGVGGSSFTKGKAPTARASLDADLERVASCLPVHDRDNPWINKDCEDTPETRKQFLQARAALHPLQIGSAPAQVLNCQLAGAKVTGPDKPSVYLMFGTHSTIRTVQY